MKFPHELFKSAGLNSSDIAALIGVSRVTGYRWLQGGAGVNVFLREKVAKLADKIEAAVAGQALPNPDVANLPPGKRAARLRTIVNQQRAKK